MPDKILYPVSALFRDVLPPNIISGMDAILEFLAIDPEFTESEWTHTHIAARFRIYILRHLEFDLPLLTGFSVHIGEPDSYPFVDLILRSQPIPGVKIDNLALTLHAPPNILQEYEREGEINWRPKPDVAGYNFTFETGLSVDVEGNLDVESPDLTGLPPFMVADTGFILDFTESRSSEDPTDVRFVNSDATADIIQKVPPGFKGLFIARAGMHYFKGESGTRLPRIGLEDAAIGSGGFSGKAIIGDEREDPAISEERLNAEDFNPSELRGDHLVGFELAGMQIVLWHLRLGFRQSIPSNCLLTGLVFLPFADKWMKFKAAIGGPDADFMLELGGAADSPLISLEHELFTIKADSIAYKLKDDIHYAIIKGSIQPKLEGIDWPEMKVEQLSVSSEGDIDIEGGWLKAPETINLNFHAFRIGINEIGFGNEGEGVEKRQWLGFSGEMALVEGLPLSASVEGLKFSWLKDPPAGSGDRKLKVSLKGIAVSLEIPNTLKFEGSVSYKELTAEDESAHGLTGHLFTGNIHINIMALRTEIEGELIIGKLKTPDGHEFTCFYIVLAAELPSPIPLAATGTGIYGLKGLVGIHVAPTKTDESWYEWYLANPSRNVTTIRKWRPMFDEYAFGAGLTLGTQYDDGFTLNLKVLLVVLIPGPVIMLEGKANLLKQRGGDTEQEGAFYTLVVIDGREGTFQMNIDVRYTLKDIITVGAGMEAFFDFNDTRNWFVHIGKKTPESKRIRADILSLFKATAYFMIDSKSLMTGASAGFDFKKTFGPVEISLIAKISFDAAIFWKPLQLEGSIEMYAELALKIFGIGLELIMQLLLEGKAADPYWLHGLARIGLKLPWPLPDLEVKAEFTWQGGKKTEPVRPLLKGAAFIHHKASDLSWELPARETDSEPDWADATLIPVDASPVLSFARTVQNLKRVASDDPIIPLAKDEVGGEEFVYRLDDVVLFEKKPGGSRWRRVKYGINRDDSSFIIDEKSFQNAADANEPILRLWRYHTMDHTTSYEREDYTDRNPACQSRLARRFNLVHWKDVIEDQTLENEFEHMNLRFIMDVHNDDRPVVTSGSLYIRDTSLQFPEDAGQVIIQLSGQSGRCRARGYYQGHFVAELSPGRGGGVLSHSSVRQPIDRVRLEIVPGTGDLIVLELIVFKTMQRVWEEKASEGDDHPLVREAETNGKPFLKPNHHYKMQVETSVEGSHKPYAETNYFFFRTDDGPGIHSLEPVADDEKSAEFIPYHEKKANQLESYILRMLPQNGAANFYYSYDMGIHFNESYIEDLFPDKLRLQLFDRNGVEQGSSIGTPALPYLALNHPGLIAWLRTQRQDGCGAPVSRKAPHYGFAAPGILKPNRLYLAKLNAEGRAGQQTIFEFQFTTSRYSTFSDHIRSAVEDEQIRVYTLQPDGPIAVAADRSLGQMGRDHRAIMRTSMDLMAENDLLEQVGKSKALADAIDAFHTANFEKFETLDALLQPHFAAVNLENRPLPDRLEFIQIFVPGERRVLLLIESPEPLDWKRISADLTDSRRRTLNLGFLFNPDMTRAYVYSKHSFKLTYGRYKLNVSFDGSLNPEAGVQFKDGSVVNEELSLDLTLGR